MKLHETAAKYYLQTIYPVFFKLVVAISSSLQILCFLCFLSLLFLFFCRLSPCELQIEVGHAWRSLTCQSTDQQNYHGTVTSLWPGPSPHPLQHRINRLPLSLSLRSACQCPPTDPDLWPLKAPELTFFPVTYKEDHLLFVYTALCGVPPA